LGKVIGRIHRLSWCDAKTMNGRSRKRIDAMTDPELMEQLVSQNISPAVGTIGGEEWLTTFNSEFTPANLGMNALRNAHKDIHSQIEILFHKFNRFS